MKWVKRWREGFAKWVFPSAVFDRELKKLQVLLEKEKGLTAALQDKVAASEAALGRVADAYVAYEEWKRSFEEWGSDGKGLRPPRGHVEPSSPWPRGSVVPGYLDNSTKTEVRLG